MITICGWCVDARERTIAAHASGEEVSHGMCDACAARFVRDDAGRVVAPAQPDTPQRPAGPWDENKEQS